MASGDYALIATRVRDPIVASFCPGTYVWVITKGGTIIRVKISDGTKVVHSTLRGDPKCLYTDATTIWIGMGDGRLLSYTVATKATLELKRLDSAITSMSVNTGVIYLTTVDGKIHSYEI